MHEFIDFCREFAPVASIFASLATVVFIPMLRTLNKIDNKLAVVSEWKEGHEKLDDTRFKAFENRLNELTRQPGEFE